MSFLKNSKSDFDNFYVLGCSFVRSRPILDFIVYADSYDPKDSKNDLKKAIEGHTKAARPTKTLPNEILMAFMFCSVGSSNFR